MSEDRQNDTGVRAMDEWVVSHVRSLEASVRRLRAALVMVVVAAIVWGGAPLLLQAGREAGVLPGDAYPETVRAKEFVLLDGAGAERGTWTVDDAGSARFHLRDQEGVARMRLSVLDTGSPGMSLRDEQGRAQVVLAALPSQSGSLAFADHGGTTRVVLGMAQDDGATLVFADARGETRAGIGVTATGEPTFVLLESEGEGGDTSRDGPEQ